MQIKCKPFCASGTVVVDFPSAHSLCMARQKTFLRQWRKHRSKTLEGVADQLHMSHSQLSRIERGEQPYNQELLEALADLYMCDVVDLLIRDPSQQEAIWTLWQKAKPGERRQIEAIADALLKQAS
jgi:transcriptional regulator with XRE-family HTH domain